MRESRTGSGIWQSSRLFAAGLASKPMVITLPFVLLLLDYWPLARVRGGNMSRATCSRHSLVTTRAREVATVCSLRRQRSHHDAGATGQRSHSHDRGVFFRSPHRDRDLCLRDVPVEDDLARATGASLSASRRFARVLASSGRSVGPARDLRRWCGECGPDVICSSAGAGFSELSSQSSDSCRLARLPWPTVTLTSRSLASL